MTYQRPSHLGTRAGVPLRWVASLTLCALVLVASAHPAQRAGVVGTGTPASCTEAALDAALVGGGLVTFACGPDPVTITITSTKVIDADTTIDGGSMITISGGNSVGVFSVVLSGNVGIKFTVQNLTIANGTALFGGGISNGGTLTVTNSTFSGNSASIGGGIANVGTLTVTNSAFSGNSGVAGGGIANGGTLGGTLMVTNSSFFDNSGYNGGAIANGAFNFPGGALTVTNSTFSGNTATGWAGAINSNNTCRNGLPCPATLTNAIVANSSGGNCAGRITDGGHNLDSDGTCGVGPATDPLLDPAGLSDHGGPTQTIALLPGSPAVDAGDPEVCANAPVNGLDQRGYVRPRARATPTAPSAPTSTTWAPRKWLALARRRAARKPPSTRRWPAGGW